MFFNILKLTILINSVFASEQEDDPSKKNLKILRIDPENSVMNQYLPFENYNCIYDLSFENNLEIEYIPDNINYLWNLNSLNIKDTNIRNLPYEFITRLNGVLKLTVDPEFQEYGEGDTIGYREIMSKLTSRCMIEGIEYKPNNYTREEIKTLFEKAPLHWNFDFFCKTCGLGECYFNPSKKNLKESWEELNNYKIKGELRTHLNDLINTLCEGSLASYLKKLSDKEKLKDKEEAVDVVDLAKHSTPECLSNLHFYPNFKYERIPSKNFILVLYEILYFIFDEIKDDVKTNQATNTTNNGCKMNQETNETVSEATNERIAFMLDVIETSFLKRKEFSYNIDHIYNMSIKYDESDDKLFLEEFIKRSIFTEQSKLLRLANVGGEGDPDGYMERIGSGEKPPVIKGNYDVTGHNFSEPYCIKTDEEALYALISKMTPKHAIDVLKVSINTHRGARRRLVEIIKNDENLSEEQKESFFVKEGEEYCSLHVRKLQSNLFKKGRSFLNYREAKGDINEKGIEYFLLEKKWLINKSN